MSTLLPPQTAPETRTRVGDPDTSLVAAASVNMRAAYLRILKRLTDSDNTLYAVTYHHIIDAANYGRLTELERAGLIRVVGKSRRGRLWVITDKGREAIA